MKISNIVIAILFFFIMSDLNFSQEQTCCSRTIVIPDVALPEGQRFSCGWSTDFSQVLIKEMPFSSCPQLEILRETKKDVADYIFRLELIVIEVTGRVREDTSEGYGGDLDISGGELIGKFKLKADLFDPNHNEVLRSGEISWEGKMCSYAGQLDETETLPSTRFNYVSALAATFQPLGQLIPDHERIPESSTNQLPGDKKEFLAGEEIEITVKDLKDRKGNQARDWQHILIEPKLGKITNAIEQLDNMYLFKVGNGNIKINYVAPENCESGTTELLKIHNSCGLGGTGNRYMPERKISEVEFEIVCVQGTIEYNHKIDFDYEAFSQTVTITGSVPFKLEESAEGTQGKQKVKGKGTVNLSLIWTAEDCVGRSDSPGEIEFEGEIINENEEKFIDIKFDEKWYQNSVLTVTCPEVTKSVPMTIPPPVKYENMKFKFKDGEKITRPFAGMGGNGTYSWTIRLPDSAE